MAAMATGDMDAAHNQVQLARASSPNSPTALAVEGHVLLHTGQPEQARHAMAACLRLDPRGPLSPAIIHRIAITYYYERDYANSAEASLRCLARYPGAVATYRWLAAALGQLGRVEEARAALHKALELSPGLFDLYTRRRPRWHSPEDYNHMLEGLRNAGWQG
jgi:adenylate cyclase